MTDPLGFGIPTVINAGGAQSRLGGSVLGPEVRTAMDRASTVYVEVERLHDRVGEQLAQLTRNEAAAVSAGSAASVMVAVAASIVGADPERAARHPQRMDAPPAVAVWGKHVRGPLAGADAIHENGYINSIYLGGGRVRVMDDVRAVRDDDAAVVWFPGMYGIAQEDDLLAALAEQAAQRGVPLIVDAADQIPPFANTWRYTREFGATLAVFSGGKGLGGPASTSLVVGSAAAIGAFRANSGTEHSAGRVAKVGREELVGLLEAVRLAADLDEDERYRTWQAVVERWRAHLENLGIPRVSTLPDGHCGQRVPRLTAELATRSCRDAVIDALWQRDPRIAILPETDARIAVSPQLVRADEVDAVGSAVAEEVVVHRCASCSHRR